MSSAEGEIANKRVALSPNTWATLSNLRKPGQTFDDTIAELISEHQRKQLITDLDDIDATGKTVPWEKAKKGLGLS
jgi:predicted outer membrane protein